MKRKPIKSDEEWRKKLTSEQFKVLREKQTELPFTGKYLSTKEKGVYRCATCGDELFSSDAKFDSGTGWPSFDSPVSKKSVTAVEDASQGMKRTEVVCANCGSHLGHVFDDDPTNTGKRYCINSTALDFQNMRKKRLEKATFGAGCFWHVEETFRNINGVVNTAAGYMGGSLEHPTYEDVCTDKTGYAEVAQVDYDPAVVSYDRLLDIFWENHDPTTLNRQGPDQRTQYRSVIFYHTDQQKQEAVQSKEQQEKSGKYKHPIVTEVTKASTFYRAEEYHQKYLMKRGEKSCRIL